MKKLLSIVLAVLMVASLVPVSVFAATSASGAITPTPGWYDASKSELTISSVEDLWAFMTEGTQVQPSQTVKLTCDLDVNPGWVASVGAAAPTNVWSTLYGFNGTFDGQGHSIRGIYIDGGGVGLVTYLAGTIKNLALENAFMKGYFNGLFAKEMQNGSLIEGCYTDAVIVGTDSTYGYLGGFACQIQSGATVTIRKSWFDGTIVASADMCAGFVADQSSAGGVVLEDCLFTGSIIGSGRLAGLSDGVYSSKITATRCVSNGLIATSAEGTQLSGSGISFVSRSGSTNTLTGCYTVRGTASTSLPVLDLSDDVIHTIDGVAYTAAEVRAVADTLCWVDNATDASAYAGIDFTGDTWSMGQNGPVLKAWMFRGNEYIISSYELLKAWASLPGDDAGKTVKLTNDISATGTWVPKANFAGTFDGQGYSILGLTGDNGLILNAASTAVVKNLAVKNATVGKSDLDGVGVFAAYANGGAQFLNLYSNATVNAKSNAGGIVGACGAANANQPVVIDDCWFDGTISATSDAAGILGDSSNGYVTISDCLNTGSVSGNDSGIAGIVGALCYDSSASHGVVTLTNCVNNGSISAPNAGGILGAVACGSAAYQFNEVYTVTGKAAYDAVGSMQADYLPAVKPVAEDQLDALDLGDGWIKTGRNFFAPSLFAYESNVIRIDDEADFRALANGTAANALVFFTDDVTLSDDAFAGITLGEYTVLDGNGYAVKNIHGSFGDIAANATVKNLIIENASTSGDALINNLYGKLQNVTFKNFTNTKDEAWEGIINNAQPGAVLEDVVFDGCTGIDAPIITAYWAVTLDGVRALSNCQMDYAGLILSTYETVVIRNCQVSATIKAATVPADLAFGAGGFVLFVNDFGDSVMTFENCIFDGVLDCSDKNGCSGFVGNTSADTIRVHFEDCVAAGSLTNASFVAAGFHSNLTSGTASFKDCLSLTHITSPSGALIGEHFADVVSTSTGGSISIDNCFTLSGVNAGSYPRYIPGDETYVKLAFENNKELASAEEFASVAASLGWTGGVSVGDQWFPAPSGMGNMMDVTNYKASGTYPVQDGKQFAGWFTDASCETPYTEKTGIAYPKFVDEKVATIGAQYVENHKGSGKGAVRFVSTVDSLDYTAVGFKILGGYNDESAKRIDKDVSSVLTMVNNSSYTNAAAFSGSEDSAYFFAVNVIGITDGTKDNSIAVTPYYKTLDGTVVWGNTTRVASYSFLAD